MELLVMTLAYTTPVRDSDALARVRLVGETIHNAPGIVSSQLYRGRGTEPCYAILSTWEDEEAWRRSRERYSPRHLLAVSQDVFIAPPEQWYLTYLWGYNRPSTQPIIASMHLATVPLDKVDVVQRGWIEGLRRQAVDPLLAFSFLARGTDDSLLTLPPAQTSEDTSPSPIARQGTLFLNLLSWASDGDRELFFSDPDYKAIRRFLKSMGILHILSLEPM